jgi:hypothetical protein
MLGIQWWLLVVIYKTSGFRIEHAPHLCDCGLLSRQIQRSFERLEDLHSAFNILMPSSYPWADGSFVRLIAPRCLIISASKVIAPTLGKQSRCEVLTAGVRPFDRLTLYTMARNHSTSTLQVSAAPERTFTIIVAVKPLEARVQPDHHRILLQRPGDDIVE